MAGKARVHELAKELGVTSKEVLARLNEQGEFVKSASSTVEAPVARRLREAFGGSKPAPEKAAARSPQAGPPSGGVQGARQGGGSSSCQSSCEGPGCGSRPRPRPGDRQIRRQRRGDRRIRQARGPRPSGRPGARRHRRPPSPRLRPPPAARADGARPGSAAQPAGSCARHDTRAAPGPGAEARRAHPARR